MKAWFLFSSKAWFSPVFLISVILTLDTKLTEKFGSHSLTISETCPNLWASVSSVTTPVPPSPHTGLSLCPNQALAKLSSSSSPFHTGQPEWLLKGHVYAPAKAFQWLPCCTWNTKCFHLKVPALCRSCLLLWFHLYHSLCSSHTGFLLQ